ncbi:MAG: hypothetical protein Rubg2KO_32590 [Rubricoccaceae bacterium]
MGLVISSRVCEGTPRYRGYRVPSARLPGFDYGHGVFHVVIVTKHRRPWFGRVHNGRVELADAGRVVWDEWARTGALRAGVTLDAFVVMPDHVHAVIGIRRDDDLRRDDIADAGGAVPISAPVKTPRRGVSTAHDDGMGHPKRQPPNGHRPGWKPDTLGSIVGRFKYACTRRIRATHPAFAWQPRFYDVVIRDRRQLEHVRRYIADNPSSWRG